MILIYLPTGFEEAGINKDLVQSKGKILSVDNSGLIQNGLITTGTQKVSVVILNGPFKDDVIEGNNLLTGRKEFDKVFHVNDHALITFHVVNSEVQFIEIVDHYRLNAEFILVVMFVLALIILGGWTGIKSILSFIFTLLCIWKVIIPLFLSGSNPIVVSLCAVIGITFVIVFLVAGLSKAGLVAFLGSISGEITTCLLAILFGGWFNVNGAVIPFAEALMYTGIGSINLTQILFSGIFIASSGAVMDVAMDISVSLNELVEKKPDITRIELFKSGIKISRAVIGTMTTTLLLAYSGGYTAMLMIFMAKGIPMMNILNYTFVSSEILKTLVGSFGLILVAPLTSFIGSMVYVKRKSSAEIIESKSSIKSS